LLQFEANNTDTRTPEDKCKLEALDDHVNTHTTDVFLEAGNATTMSTDAFQLLLPIFRVLVASSRGADD
jgi:hypothetical protein